MFPEGGWRSRDLLALVSCSGLIRLCLIMVVNVMVYGEVYDVKHYFSYIGCDYHHIDKEAKDTTRLMNLAYIAARLHRNICYSSFRVSGILF